MEKNTGRNWNTLLFPVLYRLKVSDVLDDTFLQNLRSPDRRVASVSWRGRAWPASPECRGALRAAPRAARGAAAARAIGRRGPLRLAGGRGLGRAGPCAHTGLIAYLLTGDMHSGDRHDATDISRTLFD